MSDSTLELLFLLRCMLPSLGSPFCAATNLMWFRASKNSSAISLLLTRSLIIRRSSKSRVALFFSRSRKAKFVLFINWPILTNITCYRHTKQPKKCVRRAKKKKRNDYANSCAGLTRSCWCMRANVVFLCLDEKRSYDSAFMTLRVRLRAFFFIFGIMTTFGWPLIPTRIHRPAFSAFYTNAWNENRNNKSRYDTALDSFLFLLQPNDCLFVLNDSCAILCSRFRVFCVVREKRPSLTNRERQRTLKKNCCQHIPAPINWAPISKLQIERFFPAT